MKTTFRGKLMGSYLCLVLLMGGVLYGYLNHSLEDYLLAEIKGNLANEAKMAALMANREMGDLRQHAPAFATAVGKEIKARVTIIAINGEVTGDSQVKPEDLKGLENHYNRPEILTAQKKRLRHCHPIFCDTPDINALRCHTARTQERRKRNHKAGTSTGATG